MDSDTARKGSDLLIVDNSDTDWKVLRYLQDWADLSNKFDIATGYFEIGALLALEGKWQQLEKIRILMGDTVSKSTRDALLDGISKALDGSLENEKEKNDFLTGVPSIVSAIGNKQIECKVYTKNKFHAKAYITYAKHAVVGPAALIGSSNFTRPGLTTNIELNVQMRREVEILQDWYKKHWDEAEDVSEDILKVIERHTRDYTPFDIYAKSLQEFFRGHEMTVGEWEKTESKLYNKLDAYQREGYRALLKIAGKHGGAFLCDGVGLGKTFIGLMLIERLIMFNRKRVALFVPKAARKPVWKSHIDKYIPHVGSVRDFNSLSIFNHTDLLRVSDDFPSRFERMKEMADVIIIDEAHHFRNPGIFEKTRYWKLMELCEGKTVFMLTATPVNNSLRDLQHMIELFTYHQPDYFQSSLGIHSLPGHFNKLEKDLEKILFKKVSSEFLAETNEVEAEKVLINDTLFRALVVQRSRNYVRRSQEQSGSEKIIFPNKKDPQVVKYNLKKTYGHLLEIVEKAFAKDKPLFSLAMYYPLFYAKTPPDTTKMDVAFKVNRQKQLVRLIRLLFLKRFESSAYAFEMSCQDLLLKMLAFLHKNSKTDGEKSRLERWVAQHSDLLEYIKKIHLEIKDEEQDDENEDIISPELLEAAQELPRDEYDVTEILEETFLDMGQVLEFLNELKKFKPVNDDKLKALIKLLSSDNVLREHKVLIFSEFMTTARYLKQQLQKAGFTDLDEIDSADKRERDIVISQFAPYYNDLSSSRLIEMKLKETRILISTDVLSEGLNLQDATRLINYDIHWNPVRLMQRIGRVDRRLNPDIEAVIKTDHPEQKDVRETVAYWNFLPPDELELLLRLYQRVSNKTLRISTVFGIEGKKLLKPEDDYDALKDFLHDYEGTRFKSVIEEMRLEYNQLLKNDIALERHLDALPGRVFSGKQHPSPDTHAVFFCYSLPAPRDFEDSHQDDVQWSEDAGYVQWYLYDMNKNAIVEGPDEIIEIVRSKPDTPRYCSIPQATLADIRKDVEKHIKNTYLKKLQAPVGVKASLKAWMELS